MQGVVTDVNGAAIPGAPWCFITTDGSRGDAPGEWEGHYIFDFASRHLHVLVEQAGFKKSAQKA